MAAPDVDAAVRGLYKSAQRFAQRSAADLAAGRADDSMANAGIALEHMAKAYLASEHPLLVVGSKQGSIDPAGMLWALARPTRASGGTGITINASEAIRRCCILLPQLSEKDLRPVLDARNGVLHIGFAPGSDADIIISQVARAAEFLLPKIGKESRGLWGNYYSAVMGRLHSRRDRIANRVADKLASARDSHELAFKRLGVDGVSALRAAADRYSYSENEEPMACPACRGPAVVSGSIEVEEEPGYADESDWSLAGFTLVPWLHLQSLRCQVCGLFLEGEEEIREAGVRTVLQTERSIGADE